jgi:hypothetical protein
MPARPREKDTGSLAAPGTPAFGLSTGGGEAMADSRPTSNWSSPADNGDGDHSTGAWRAGRSNLDGRRARLASTLGLRIVAPTGSTMASRPCSNAFAPSGGRGSCAFNGRAIDVAASVLRSESKGMLTNFAGALGVAAVAAVEGAAGVTAAAAPAAAGVEVAAPAAGVALGMTSVVVRASGGAGAPAVTAISDALVGAGLVAGPPAGAVAAAALAAGAAAAVAGCVVAVEGFGAAAEGLEFADGGLCCSLPRQSVSCAGLKTLCLCHAMSTLRALPICSAGQRASTSNMGCRLRVASIRTTAEAQMHTCVSIVPRCVLGAALGTLRQDSTQETTFSTNRQQ